MPGLRRGAQRRLRHDGAALRHAALQVRVLGRVGHVHPACDGRDGAPGPQRALVRRRVYAARHAGHHDQPGQCQVGCQQLCHALAVDGSVAGADQRHGAVQQQGSVADDGQQRRRRVEAGQRRRVAGAVEEHHAPLELGELVHLALGGGDGRRWRRRLAAAGAGQAGQGVNGLRRGGEAAQQPAVGDGANAVRARQAQAVQGLGWGHLPWPMRGSVPSSRRRMLPA